jgi:hypothetical protein
VQITASAVSLNVEDVAASSAFLIEHFGFRQLMAADGFASLAREDTALYVVVRPARRRTRRDNPGSHEECSVNRRSTCAAVPPPWAGARS